MLVITIIYCIYEFYSYELLSFLSFDRNTANTDTFSVSHARIDDLLSAECYWVDFFKNKETTGE